MPGRSLIASTAGIEKAKKALKRRNLTQKAITYEIEISWSTVSKFFNGKPVDRSFFLDICQLLELDWQEIAASEIDDSPDDDIVSPEFAAIERLSDRARAALEPYILPRIRRETLLEKCLKTIRRGVAENKQRVTAILGAAGYGKSTLLGSIYDELSAEFPDSWLILVRCNDLIESAETFPLELGEKASGKRESIADIAERLTQQAGRGVLLIDTLDLALEKKLIPVLRALLAQLLEIGVTVAFTCRDRDFEDFFEPYHESFAGFSQSVDRIFIPQFEEAEVREAARAFFCRLQSVETSPEADDFAAKIIALSADSQSLSDITRNPLLLALLCDLFTADENVPEDLTVGQLFEKYWNLRIARGRKNRDSAARVGREKINLCLKLAKLMYEQSSDRLRDFAYKTQLELDEIQLDACAELESDGILVKIGGERLIFFHQTFLEYAIARWFESTPEGESAKTNLLTFLSQPETAYSKHYLWAIIRQLLNQAASSEFTRIASTFNQREILPFRAIALAAVSHSQPQVSAILSQLLPVALEKGVAYQDTLLVAAKSAANRHLETAWKIVVELLRETGQALNNKTAEIAGEMLTRGALGSTGERLEQAMAAIEARATGGDKQNEERSHCFGKLIAAYAQTPKIFGRGIDASACEILRKQYFHLGSQTRACAIDLHRVVGVPESVQREFLLTIVARRTHEVFKEKDSAAELLKYLLPGLLQSGDTLFGNNWIDALHAPLPEEWDKIQAAAVGARAAVSPELASTLLGELLQPTVSQEDSSFLRRTQMACSESIKHGSSQTLATALLATPLSAIPSNRISTACSLIRELSPEISAPQKESFADWIFPLAEKNLLAVIPTLDALAENCPPVEKKLGTLLRETLPGLEPNQVGAIVKKLNHIPAELEAYLKSTAAQKESRVALVKYYHKKVVGAKHSSANIDCQPKNDIRECFAPTAEAGFSELLKFCLDKSRDVALDASRRVLEIAQNGEKVKSDRLIEIIAASQITGVRQNCLKALIGLAETGELEETALTNLCRHMQEESATEIIQPLYKIVESWVRASDRIPPEVAERTFNLTERLLREKSGNYLESGTAKAAFIALKNIANLEQVSLSEKLGDCTRKLLRGSNINRAIDHIFVIGILDKIAKSNQDFLAQIVAEDCVREGEIMPVANQCAVVVAIAHNQGKNAPLLDEILQHPQIPEEVKNRVIRERD